MAWDSGSPKQQASVQARALKVQLVDAVGPFSPFWRDRFTALGRTAAQAATVEADTRPTTFVFAGLGMRFPIASTHGDLDVVVGLQRRALAPELSLRSGTRGVDLRAVCAALVGRGDLADWRVVVGTSQRRSTVGVVVHVVPRSDVDPSDVAVGVALDVRVAAGLLPTQVVVDDAGACPTRTGSLDACTVGSEESVRGP
jgi:hypothetical protein